MLPKDLTDSLDGADREIVAILAYGEPADWYVLQAIQRLAGHVECLRNNLVSLYGRKEEND
jgi:hypothetical protein